MHMRTEIITSEKGGKNPPPLFKNQKHKNIHAKLIPYPNCYNLESDSCSFQKSLKVDLQSKF